MATRFSAVFSAATLLLPLTAFAQTGCLSGNVVDNTGAPVPGIRITVGDNVWTSAQISPEPHSDESGQFRIDGIPPGAYNANAFNDQLGYPGIWWPVQKISIEASSICTNITFNVSARAAKLKFTVTDATTNEPIKNILYTVFPEGKPSVRLSVEPLLSHGLPPQVPSLTKLRIVVTANDYSSTEFSFSSLAPGSTQEIVTTLTPKRVGCISGIAVDNNFAPVSSATIDPRFMGPSSRDIPSPVTSDGNGKFTIENLVPGEYTLYPEKESDGFSHFWSGWTGQVPLEKITVVASNECQLVTVNLGARGALLRVRAMDAATHQPLTNITVNFNNPVNPRQGGSIVGEPREPHELLVPSHSNVIIRVRAEGYQPSDAVTIGPLSSGEVQDLSVPLQRANSSAQSDRGHRNKGTGVDQSRLLRKWPGAFDAE